MSDVMSFISPISFELPAWRPESAWIEHGPFAAWLTEQLRPRTFIELGSHSGYSFAAFCQAAKRCGIDMTAIAVDTWAGDEHAGYYGEAIFKDLEAHLAATYPRAEMRRMTFAEALPTVADKSVDLLHVDGRHFYDDVRDDHTTWVPKLSNRAVVLFHDTQVRERGFGVYRYWAELMPNHATFEFHHGNGLGVLAFGSDVSPSIKKLCSLGACNTADGVREAYERLGMGIASLQMRDQKDSMAARKAERRALRRAPHKALFKAISSRLGR